MPAPPPTAPAPGRRAVLRTGLAGVAVGAVLGTTGCRLRIGSPSSAGPPPTPAPTPGPDQLALGRAAGRASDLGVSYDQAVQVRPDLAAGLRRLAADHTAHLQAIQTVLGTTATATGSPTAGSPTTPARAPLSATTALSVLGQSERAATAANLAELGPVGPQAARLLASIAACGSAHVAVLAGLPARPVAR